MGYSPWGHKESDTTDRLSTDASLTLLTRSTHTFTSPEHLPNMSDARTQIALV